MNLSLFWKILLAILITSLLPLLLISYTSTSAINEIGNTAKNIAASELDSKSIDALQVRAEQIAANIAKSLDASVQDTLFVASLPRTPESFLQFYHTRQGKLWYQAGTPDQPYQIIQYLPRYTEISWVNASGMEIIRIENGKVLSDGLRNVADPNQTTYKSETYFKETSQLTRGEVYASPVTAWYVANPKQPAQATNDTESRFQYFQYTSIIRFATPTFDAQGKFDGILVLTLDFRHVMELVNHVYPNSEDIVWPDYASGNYAYLLDNEGWVVVHPNFTAMKGLDENGEVMPTIMASTKSEMLPLNMLHSDVKPAANEISRNVLSGQTGNLQALNQKGALKVDVYVPIPFKSGVYKEKGVFGGVVLSENVENIEKAGEISGQIIKQSASKIRQSLIWIALISLAVVSVAVVVLSRNITHPIRQLTEAARLMEKGELDTQTLQQLIGQKIKDEVTELAKVFKQMAEAVQLREKRLREEVQMLRIQIDEQKKQQEVESIVQSEVFQQLQEKARILRARRQARNKPE